MADDPLIDIAIVIIGAFIGSILAFFIPRFFGWKGEYRKEKIEQLTKLLEECYGPLRYRFAGDYERIIEFEKSGRVTGNLKSERPKLFDEVGQIYNKYYHELDDQECLHLKELLDILKKQPGKDIIKPSSWVYFKKASEIIVAKHADLSEELIRYRELKKGVKRTITFHFTFWTLEPSFPFFRKLFKKIRK